MIPSRARRVLFVSGAVLLLLALVGATYQGAATALERRQFPLPGHLIDVGGHQLHIYCTGNGPPTVVLEAPATAMSAAWGWVQPAVASTTRVCSYDRAGLGWSEAGDGPFEPEAVTEELHALLEGAGEPAPFVLAGHGLGAAYAALYAARFGGDLAALVLIDPPTPEASAAGARSTTTLVDASPWLARAGLLRATRLMSSYADGLPQPAAGALAAFLNRPDHLTRAARELSRWEDIVRLAAGAGIDPSIPVVRLTATGPGRLALLTERSRAEEVSTAIRDVLADLARR